jgi:hypothetical protein
MKNYLEHDFFPQPEDFVFGFNAGRGFAGFFFLSAITPISFHLNKV